MIQPVKITRGMISTTNPADPPNKKRGLGKGKKKGSK